MPIVYYGTTALCLVSTWLMMAGRQGQPTAPAHSTTACLTLTVNTISALYECHWQYPDLWVQGFSSVLFSLSLVPSLFLSLLLPDQIAHFWWRKQKYFRLWSYPCAVLYCSWFTSWSPLTNPGYCCQGSFFWWPHFNVSIHMTSSNQEHVL